MDEQDNGVTGAPDQATPETPQPNGADTAPAVGLLSQYVKDMSFENPSAPAIYQNATAPQIDVQFNIGASQVGEDVHEVVLKIDVRAQAGDAVAFVVDLSYAGLFGMRNVPAEHIQPFILGEAPRLLFPFARRVLADAVRDGGFPPLLLEPIDFNGLYLQQAAQRTAEGGAPTSIEGVGNA
jgi:preprotein translocase subunit SecB